MQRLVLNTIKLYQLTHHLRRPACRFHPTCSQYMYDAINKYGTIRGILLGFKRILRCHPWSKGGLDPVI